MTNTDQIHALPHIHALDERCNDAVGRVVELSRQLEEARRLLRDLDHRLAEAREEDHQACLAYSTAVRAAREQLLTAARAA